MLYDRPYGELPGSEEAYHLTRICERGGSKCSKRLGLSPVGDAGLQSQ
jgi:hypothetical protein